MSRKKHAIAVRHCLILALMVEVVKKCLTHQECPVEFRSDRAFLKYRSVWH